MRSLTALLGVAWLTAASLSLPAQEPTPLLTRSPDQLVAVLQSNAGQKEKSDACRELAVVGTKDAVPALVPLLADEKLSHMARYALETLPDPAVDGLLRSALGTTSGRQKLGIISSLGARRDLKAVKPLGALLNNADPEVAQAAARALGRIGTADAAESIQAALAGTSPANQLAFCEGLFRAAEALTAKGQKKRALALYRDLRAQAGLPHQVRAAALRGAVWVDPKAGLRLLHEAFRSTDYTQTAAAARLVLELPGPEVTQLLTSEIPTLNGDKQVLIVQALGQRRDTAALPTLFPLAQKAGKAVRLAALRALAEIGDASAVPAFLGSLKEADADVAQTAQEGLASIAAPQAEASIVALLGSPDAADRQVGLELVGRRRLTTALPRVLQSTGDSDARVRTAAYRRLGELGGTREMASLLDLLLQAKDPAQLAPAEQALGNLLARQEDPPAFAAPVAEKLAAANALQKGALLRVLGVLGGPAALQTVRQAVDQTDPEVHGAALRVLASWKSAEAAPELLGLAKSATDATDRTLCLRAFLGWAANTDLPADQRLAMCRDSASLLRETDEKKLWLAALGKGATGEAFALAAPHLEDPALKEEASAAVVAIAAEWLKADAAAAGPKVLETLQKAASGAANNDVANKARGLIEKLPK